MTAPKKRYGQHFLVDPSCAARIVRSAAVVPGEKVLEVGPGRGILTQSLLAAGAQLRAVEIDKDLLGPLRQRFPDLDLIEGDATTLDWSVVCPGSGWQVVANLPYNVATPLVVGWVSQPETFSRLTVMLQHEVAERLVAKVGDEAWGRLSIAIAIRAQVTWVMSLPPGAFKPPPKVRSAVVRIEPRPAPDFGPAGEAAFEKVVQVAFGQRRKTLRNALMASFPASVVDEALSSIVLDGTRRAETLEIDIFRHLAAALRRGLEDRPL